MCIRDRNSAGRMRGKDWSRTAALAQGRNRQNADSMTSRSTPTLPARSQCAGATPPYQLCCQMWNAPTAQVASTRTKSAAAGRSVSMGAGARFRTPIRRFQRS